MFLLLTLPLLLRLQATDDTIRAVPWRQELALGKGCNENGDQVVDIALFRDLTPPPTPYQPHIELSAYAGSQEFSSQQQLDMTASTSVRGLVASGDAKVHFKSMSQQSESSSDLHIHIEKTWRGEYIDTSKLVDHVNLRAAKYVVIGVVRHAYYDITTSSASSWLSTAMSLSIAAGYRSPSFKFNSSIDLAKNAASASDLFKLSASGTNNLPPVPTTTIPVSEVSAYINNQIIPKIDEVNVGEPETALIAPVAWYNGSVNHAGSLRMTVLEDAYKRASYLATILGLLVKFTDLPTVDEGDREKLRSPREEVSMLLAKYEAAFDKIHDAQGNDMSLRNSQDELQALYGSDDYSLPKDLPLPYVRDLLTTQVYTNQLQPGASQTLGLKIGIPRGNYQIRFFFRLRDGNALKFSDGHLVPGEGTYIVNGRPLPTPPTPAAIAYTGGEADYGVGQVLDLTVCRNEPPYLASGAYNGGTITIQLFDESGQVLLTVLEVPVPSI